MQLESRSASEDAAVAILRQAIDAGVNHIDTAQFYPGCNTVIRTALTPFPDDLVLATKVGAERDPEGKLVPAQRPAQLRAQVEENLATLGAEQVGVVNLRRLDARPGILAEGDQVVSLDDQLAELATLREEGKIGAIGLSNVSADQLGHALPAGIACVQNSYSLLDRATEPVLALCRQHAIAWAPYFPLGSAFPSMPRVIDNAAVLAIAAELSVTPAQVGLAWQLAYYQGTLLIPGTADLRHLAENVAAGVIKLPPASLAALSQLAG